MNKDGWEKMDDNTKHSTFYGNINLNSAFIVRVIDFRPLQN